MSNVYLYIFVCQLFVLAGTLPDTFPPQKMPARQPARQDLAGGDLAGGVDGLVILKLH